jgi:hypothetical protein
MTTTRTVDAIPADREPIPTVAPRDWETSIPRYRVTNAVKPAEKARFRLEPPFASVMNPEVWQYGTEPLARNQIVETTEWPHPNWVPLSYSAKKTLEFFNSGIKSRMARSPWHNGRLVLNDGVSSDGPPRPITVRPEPFDTHSAA